MSKRRVTPVITIASLMLLLSFISGCSNSPASVSDRGQPPSIKIKSHRVDVGETLYSIAWRYDLNVRELANTNSLKPPYTINPGQKLSLILTKKGSTLTSVTRHAVNVGDTLFSIASKYGLAVGTLARINHLTPPYIIKPGQIITVDSRFPGPIGPSATQGSQSTVAKSNSSATSRPQSKNKAPVYSDNWQWKWPVDGEVVETFNPGKLQKGIKIKSSSGRQVRAAAPGNVVYAGSGLRGYGRLIIIKHSDILLSAYANNDKLLVSVGQSVQQTDVISSLGVDGTMYFEIRKDGDPVNPISYLN